MSFTANIVLKTSRCIHIKSYLKTSRHYLSQFRRDSAKDSQGGNKDYTTETTGKAVVKLGKLDVTYRLALIVRV